MGRRLHHGRGMKIGAQYGHFVGYFTSPVWPDCVCIVHGLVCGAYGRNDWTPPEDCFPHRHHFGTDIGQICASDFSPSRRFIAPQVPDAVGRSGSGGVVRGNSRALTPIRRGKAGKCAVNR
jgi:hypothetical protein